MFYSFILATIFVFGLCVGSFINALEYRLGTQLSIVRGRSICPQCRKQLAWYDNIPLLSFAMLKGKCRQCQKQISWQYPVVELLTGLGFVAVTLKITNYQLPITNQITILQILSLCSLYSIFSILILVALHDQKTTYVLSAYVYAAMAFTLIYLLALYTGFWGPKEVIMYLLPNIGSALLAALPFALLFFFSKGVWMGAGDIEIAALLGLLLGWPYLLVALYFAFIIGSIWGVAKVYMFKNAKLKSEIPFAPFLIAGILFALLIGQQVVSLYVNIFLG